MGPLALLHQFDEGKSEGYRRLGTDEYIHLEPVDARTGQHQLSVFLERLEVVAWQG
jgi:hypothetical protein